MKQEINNILNVAINNEWGYQGTDRFKNYFYPNISKYFNVLKDMDVLDLGCCSGIFSFSITEYASSCTGIEYNKKFANHFNEIRKATRAPMKVFCNSIDKFIENEIDNANFNALFAANILYHLDNNTIELIENKILPKCNKVLLFSRENKPKKNNKYSLHSWVSIKKLLEKNGFKVSRLDNKEIYKDYTTSANNINRKVEKSHTDSILIPVFGTK